MAKTKITREEWLERAVRKMAAWLKEAGLQPAPKPILVSVGVPVQKKRGQHTIGQCWYHSATTEHHPDGVLSIFLCPTMGNPKDVLATLLHEMIHASLGYEAGHKKPFKEAMAKVGLAGKATATHCEPGSPLDARLDALCEELGPYPHTALMVVKREKGEGDGEEKERKGWTRLKSIVNDKYTCLVSPKNLEEHGFPVDPWGQVMEPKETE